MGAVLGRYLDVLVVVVKDNVEAAVRVSRVVHGGTA